MALDKIHSIISAIKVPVDHPLFFQKVFTLVSKDGKAALAGEGDSLKKVCCEEYDDLSRRLDKTKIQESTSVRNVLRTRKLATRLINDKGEIETALLPKLISYLTEHLYSIGPDRQYDSKRQEHILKVLKTLQENKEAIRLIKNISKPLSHRYAEQIIRDTLQIPSSVILTDAHARRAALAAWMCYLRQNVGSCFGTAPSIIVHDEQSELMLADINELLGTGRLKRTFGGIEYSVPLSSSWGAGDLRKPFILPKSEDSEQSEIWLSPGLNSAFEAAGLIIEGSSLKERIDKTKELIFEILPGWGENPEYVIASAEEIIRCVLLKSLSLTEQDLTDFDNRPKGMLQSNLMLQINMPGQATGGKGQACSAFHAKFEAACNAFKGLADNALLKAWEFTIASFTETKSDFTRWNLYASLGLRTNEKGGIGHTIYEAVKGKLDRCNEEVQELQMVYEQAYHHIKYLEARVRNASTEKEIQWIKADYQSKMNEFYTLQEMRDDVNDKAKRFAQLFEVLIGIYDGMFARYFQEVYDADMHEVAAGPYDDSPAGFRLLYKYGRANTSQWSRINNHNEFIEALASFFTSTENEVASSTYFKGLEHDLSNIVTAIVSHVRTREFLETAFYRMAAAHHVRAIKNPLENLDKIEKKPWVYTSGGTMKTLVSVYFRREQKPTEVSRWVESPMELLVFLIDTMKQIPPKAMDEYSKDPNKAFLAESPTHAFLIKPGTRPFKDAWMNDSFTYTWVRDQLVIPREKAVESIQLNEEMMLFLAKQLAEKIDPNFNFYFQRVFDAFYGTMTPIEFRKHIVETMERERGLNYRGTPVLSADEIDSSLYSLLPLFSRGEFKERVESVLRELPKMTPQKIEKILEIWEELPGHYGGDPMISAKTLQKTVKALIILAEMETSSSIDYHDEIIKACRKSGFALPGAIIFGDTNWVRDEFGFVVNPGTGKLELWRVDAISSAGYPMTIWEQWLNGSRKDITWSVYTRPYEYSR